MLSEAQISEGQALADAVLKAAEAAYLERRYGEARDAFAALSIGEHYTDRGHYGLGLIAFHQKDIEAAEVHFDRALQTGGVSGNAMFYLGRIAQSRGDRRKADQLWRDVIRDNPDHVAARTARSQARKLRRAAISHRLRQTLVFVVGPIIFATVIWVFVEGDTPLREVLGLTSKDPVVTPVDTRIDIPGQ